MDNTSVNRPPIAGGSDGEPPAAPAPPAFVPSEEFKRFSEQIEGKMSQMADMLLNTQALLQNSVATARAAAPAPDDTIVDDLQSGDPARVRQALRREAAAATQPQMNVGLNSLQSIAFEQARPAMKLYDRFKAEVDDVLSKLTPESKTLVKTYTTAYEMVLGRHADELTEEARQQAIREASGDIAFEESTPQTPGIPRAPSREPAPTARPVSAGAPVPSGGRRRDAPKAAPTVREAFGEQAELALLSKGRGGQDADTFARRLGYKSWAEYADMAAKQSAGEES